MKKLNEKNMSNSIRKIQDYENHRHLGRHSFAGQTGVSGPHSILSSPLLLHSAPSKVLGNLRVLFSWDPESLYGAGFHYSGVSSLCLKKSNLTNIFIFQKSM